MKKLNAKFTSMTKSENNEQFDKLVYDGYESILDLKKQRNFCFETKDGKLFLFIKDNEIKEIYQNNEITISPRKKSGQLHMISKISKEQFEVKLNLKVLEFINNEKYIKFHYQIISSEKELLSEVKIEIELEV